VSVSEYIYKTNRPSQANINSFSTLVEQYNRHFPFNNPKLHNPKSNRNHVLQIDSRRAHRAQQVRSTVNPSSRALLLTFNQGQLLRNGRACRCFQNWPQLECHFPQYLFVSSVSATSIRYLTHSRSVTCADPRCNPADYLGLKPGGKSSENRITYLVQYLTTLLELTITIRNVCGHVKPNLNDILALDIAIGVEEILVVHHNDCGATHFKEDQVREALRARDPGNKDLDSAVFGAIDE
jgi:hypothetical protein